VADEDQLVLVEHPLGLDLQPVLFLKAPDESQSRVPVGDPGALIDSLVRAQNDLRHVSRAESMDLQKLLLDAAKAHRAAERVLPARFIEERLSRLAKAPPQSLVVDNDAAQREARSKLSTDLQDAKQRVTNAMSLNALPQVEASRMLKVIESLARANAGQEIGV